MDDLLLVQVRVGFRENSGRLGQPGRTRFHQIARRIRRTTRHPDPAVALEGLRRLVLFYSILSEMNSKRFRAVSVF
jgi:hypothetical protein